MQLPSGTRLGPYEIIAVLGAGGMGEVYRARDHRLQRDVAVKILPAAFSSDALAHARFEREAQAVAALSHPNILSIHDVGREGTRVYAVMELLEGGSLRDVLRDGALPVRKSIEYALQLALGLAAAHSRGIVHRDVKPENIFVCSDGRVKILDFGLAQIQPRVDDQTVTATAFDTTPGTVVGTTAYMAPEQIRGGDVDARTDIFALGLVLYEMLAGRRAFEGATSADVMSAILRGDPDELGVARPGVPAALDHLVRRCLEKSPEERFQSARDLAFALEAVAMGTSGRAQPLAAPTRTSSRRWFIAAAVLAGAVAVGVLIGRSGTDVSTSGELTPFRFTIASGLGTPPWVAVSPDGLSLAWSETDPMDNSQTIWMRRLDQPAAIALPWSGRSGAVGGTQWSADSRSFIVVSPTGVAMFDVSSGARRSLFAFADSEASPLGGLTVAGDHILFGGTVITKIPIDGGPAQQLTSVDTSRHRRHGFPRTLPDGRFVYIARRLDEGAEVFVAGPDGRTLGQLPLPPTVGRVLPDPSGAIVYSEGSAIYAQAIDWETLELVGSSLMIANNVLSDMRLGTASVDLSPTGVLAYRVAGNVRVQFEWMDRTGRTLGAIGSPDTFTNFDLSPDGKAIAVTRRDPTANRLWMIDVERSIATPIDSDTQLPPSDPTWSPDGRLLAYRRGSAVVVRPAFGGTERVLAPIAGYPDSWSPDGRFLIVGRARGAAYELVALRADGAAAEEIAITPDVSQADEGRFSPDGHWVVYHAVLERGAQSQVFATPFPPTGERFQLSATGGVQPRWRSDGRELMYLDLQGQLMSVAIPDGDIRRARGPVALFRTTLEPSSANDQFAIARDGRVLLRRPVAGGGSDQAAVEVLVNWRKIVGLE